MTTPGTVRLPPGFVLQQLSDGTFEVVANREPLRRTMSFRVTSSEYASILPYVLTFPDSSVSTSMRTLLADPRVREVMAERVQNVTRRHIPESHVEPTPNA